VIAKEGQINIFSILRHWLPLKGQIRRFFSWKLDPEGKSWSRELTGVGEWEENMTEVMGEQGGGVEGVVDLQDEEGLERMDHSFIEFEGGEMAVEEEKGERDPGKKKREKGWEDQAEKGGKEKMRAKNPEEARKQGKGRDPKKNIFSYPLFYLFNDVICASMVSLNWVLC